VYFTENQNSLLSNTYKKDFFVWNETLLPYIMFCRHFLTTELSETLGTWRHIPEERKLPIYRCENLKIVKFYIILKCVLDPSVSNFNESDFHSAADG